VLGDICQRTDSQTWRAMPPLVVADLQFPLVTWRRDVVHLQFAPGFGSRCVSRRVQGALATVEVIRLAKRMFNFLVLLGVNEAPLTKSQTRAVARAPPLLGSVGGGVVGHHEANKRHLLVAS